MVAVETRESVAIASGVRDIEMTTPVKMDWTHLAGCAHRVKCRRNS
jgi:hypothetical protein